MDHGLERIGISRGLCEGKVEATIFIKWGEMVGSLSIQSSLLRSLISLTEYRAYGSHPQGIQRSPRTGMRNTYHPQDIGWKAV